MNHETTTKLFRLKIKNMKTYVTGRNCETFKNLEDAKIYAEKCKDKSITIYQNGEYLETVHL